MKQLIIFLILTPFVLSLDGLTNYSTEDGNERTETIDNEGNVRGQYSYNGPHGKRIKVKYTAGKKGFQASGDHFAEFHLGNSESSNDHDDIKQTKYNRHEEDQDAKSLPESVTNFKVNVQHTTPRIKPTLYRRPTKNSYHHESSDEYGNDTPKSQLKKYHDSDGEIIETKFAIDHPPPSSRKPSGYTSEPFLTGPSSAITSSNTRGSNRQRKPYHRTPTTPKPRFESISHDFESDVLPINSQKFSLDDVSKNSGFYVEQPTFQSDYHLKNVKLPQKSKTVEHQYDQIDHFKPSAESNPIDFKPHFKLQDVPNLYPEGYKTPASQGQLQKYYEKQLLLEQQQKDEHLLYQHLNQNPATKGQYNQFLKAQEDELVEQKFIRDQLKLQHQHQNGNSHLRGYYKQGSPQQSHKFHSVRNNIRPHTTLGLSHYRKPAPYSIRFNL